MNAFYPVTTNAPAAICPTARVEKTLFIPFLGFYGSEHMDVMDSYLESILEHMDFTHEEAIAIFERHTDGTDWAGYKFEIARAYADWFLSSLFEEVPPFAVELISPREYNFLNDVIKVNLQGWIPQLFDYSEKELLRMACDVFDLTYNEGEEDYIMLDIESIFIDYAKANGIYDNAYFKHHKSENIALVWHAYHD